MKKSNLQILFTILLLLPYIYSQPSNLNDECKVKHCIKCPTAICEECLDGYQVDKKKNICSIKPDTSYKPARNYSMAAGIGLLVVSTIYYVVFRIGMAKKLKSGTYSLTSGS